MIHETVYAPAALTAIARNLVTQHAQESGHRCRFVEWHLRIRGKTSHEVAVVTTLLDDSDNVVVERAVEIQPKERQ